MDPRDESRVSILLVDDREEDLLAIASSLASPKHRLVRARSGPEALKRLLDEDFAVILLDVMMPGMDGFEVASVIKQRDRSRHTPIIFLTADGVDVNATYRGYSVGAVDYLVKPLDPGLLFAKVSIFVELYLKDRRIQRQAEELWVAQERERSRALAELKRTSDDRYRNLAEAIPQIVWTADAMGRVDYANRRWLDYSGQVLRTTSDWYWETSLHPDDRFRCADAWWRAVAQGTAYEVECRLYRRDGTYRWHLCRAVPERDRSGRIIGWLGTHTELDDLKRAHDQAESARRRSELLAEASALLSSSEDEQEAVALVVRLAATTVADWCVVDLFDARGLSCRSITAHRDPMREERLAALRRRFPVEPRAPRGAYEALLERKPQLLAAIVEPHRQGIVGSAAEASELQELGFRSAMIAPLISRDCLLGALTMASGPAAPPFSNADLTMAADLARRCAMSVDNLRLYRQSREAIQVRDEFLAAASHELKTPMTPLKLQIQSCQRALRRSDRAINLDAFAGRLDLADRQVDRLHTLVNTLLDVSRITGGRLHLEIEEVDLSVLVAEVAARMQADAGLPASPIELELDHPAVGRWDRTRLDQVVTNLFANALKYGRDQPIRVRVECAPERVRLTVRDQGIGIPLEDQARIFSRFERTDAARQYGGLGLGLWIVAQIVEAFGGQITVDSQPEIGSTFMVDLPRSAPGAALVELDGGPRERSLSTQNRDARGG